MKQLKSIIEGSWIEIKQEPCTSEEIAILKSEDTDAKNALRLQIKERTEVIPKDLDAAIANAKYAEIKPIIKDTEVYLFVRMDVTIETERVRGILNCKVNEELIQIRF